MSSPWKAILAGLGGGARTIGQNIKDEEEQRRKDALLKVQQDRQQAQDALSLLTSIAPLGGRVIPPGADPTGILTKATQFNNMASGQNAEGTGESAIPNSALGISEDQTPNAFGSPYVQKVGQSNVLIDPSQSREAGIERRATLAQLAAERRAQENQDRMDARYFAGLNARELPLATQMQNRIRDLVAGGKKLEDASKQARLEFGQPDQQQSFTPVTFGGGENEPPQIRPFNTKTGQAGPSLGEGKSPVTKIESATNTAAKARLEAAVSEMNNAHSNMSEYEHSLANGTANINGLSQFLGATANSFTHDDPASRAVQSAALAVLNRQNPELARYIRRGLSFAEGESMISQRPSDFRTKMAAFLSTASSGASPEMIRDIEGRRTAILNPLNRTVAPTPPSGGNPNAGNISLPPNNDGRTTGATGGVTAAQLARAAKDPEYKQFLIETGKIKP